jgi:hypothetical protein
VQVATRDRGLFVLAQVLLAQNLKLAHIALGMTETEVKTALAPNAPFYVNQASGYREMNFLVAETDAEAYVFTFIDAKGPAFSVVHILPPGQMPFLPSGQQPTVSILRDLITKQTWTPPKSSRAIPGGSATQAGRRCPTHRNAVLSQARHGYPLGRCQVQSRGGIPRNRPRA